MFIEMTSLCLMMSSTDSRRYDGALGVFYLFLLIAAVVYLAKRNRHASKETEPEDDFAYLTVREQLAIANSTADSIAEAEQLITDMQESAAEDIMMLHIEWIGRDDRRHEISFGCDGYNTATTCMIEISEREIHDLKNDLAHQCAVLSERGRNRLNRVQIGADRRGEAIQIDETLHALRDAYLDG